MQDFREIAMLTELKATLLSALSKWLGRPAASVAGVAMVSSGLPLVVVSKIFSVGTKVSVVAPYVQAEFQMDNSNETLLFVSGLSLVAIGVLLISWAMVADQSLKMGASSKLTSLLQGPESTASNSEIQQHFRTAYGYSANLPAIKAILRSPDPDMFAMDFKSAGNDVVVDGQGFKSTMRHDPAEARRKSSVAYWVISGVALLCFSSVLQPWWPVGLGAALLGVAASVGLAMLCVPLLSRIRRCNAVIRLTADQG
jgi:hypothetical protein